MIAADAPAKLGGAPRAIATCRARASASTLSEFSSAWASSTDIGCDETWPITVPPSGAVPSTSGRSGLPSSRASALPAVFAGSPVRMEFSLAGSSRSPSTISGDIRVMYPCALPGVPRMSLVCQPSASSGPDQ